MHGLRELGKEIGIIVIGVLIALGAEQAVEAMHWAHQMDVQRATLHSELLTNADWFEERVAVAPCLRARLDHLSQALANANGRWKTSDADPLIQGQGVYVAPWRNFPDQAWRNTLASGAASHMGPDEMLAYAMVYGNVADLHAMNLQEQVAANQIADLDHDQPLSETARDRYRKAVDDLSFYESGGASIAAETLRLLHTMRITPTANDIRDVTADDRKLFGACVR